MKLNLKNDPLSHVLTSHIIKYYVYSLSKRRRRRVVVLFSHSFSLSVSPSVCILDSTIPFGSASSGVGRPCLPNKTLYSLLHAVPPHFVDLFQAERIYIYIKGQHREKEKRDERFFFVCFVLFCLCGVVYSTFQSLSRTLCFIKDPCWYFPSIYHLLYTTLLFSPQQHWFFNIN